MKLTFKNIQKWKKQYDERRKGHILREFKLSFLTVKTKKLQGVITWQE